MKTWKVVLLGLSGAVLLLVVAVLSFVAGQIYARHPRGRAPRRDESIFVEAARNSVLQTAGQHMGVPVGWRDRKVEIRECVQVSFDSDDTYKSIDVLVAKDTGDVLSTWGPASPP